MNEKTAQSLIVVAIILLVTGMVVLSPTAGFPVLVLADVLAAFAFVRAPKRLRVLVSVVLLATLAAAISRYPEFRDDYGLYLKRIEKRSSNSRD